MEEAKVWLYDYTAKKSDVTQTTEVIFKEDLPEDIAKRFADGARTVRVNTGRYTFIEWVRFEDRRELVGERRERRKKAAPPN